MLEKMERKFGRFAIHNLSLYLIICYAFGYLIALSNANFMMYLTLNPNLILQGQVWRLFTWILIPPESSNIVFVVITLFFYYSIGSTLERTWGAFYYNVYLFSGMLFTVIGSFALYFIYGGVVGNMNSAVLQILGYMIGFSFTTYYINMSIFLAFAATFPEAQVLLMFILPIKVKWLGIVYAAIILYNAISSGSIYMWVVIGASLLNFVIFFLMTRKRLHRGPKQILRQHAYKQQVRQPSGVTRHKCAVCGRTEQDSPNLEFRFCSKCDGNYEYCQDHLFTHEHIHY